MLLCDVNITVEEEEPLPLPGLARLTKGKRTRRK